MFAPNSPIVWPACWQIAAKIGLDQRSQVRHGRVSPHGLALRQHEVGGVKQASSSSTMSPFPQMIIIVRYYCSEIYAVLFNRWKTFHTQFRVSLWNSPVEKSSVKFCGSEQGSMVVWPCATSSGEMVIDHLIQDLLVPVPAGTGCTWTDPETRAGRSSLPRARALEAERGQANQTKRGQRVRTASVPMHPNSGSVPRASMVSKSSNTCNTSTLGTNEASCRHFGTNGTLDTNGTNGTLDTNGTHGTHGTHGTVSTLWTDSSCTV